MCVLTWALTAARWICATRRSNRFMLMSSCSSLALLYKLDSRLLTKKHNNHWHFPTLNHLEHNRAIPDNSLNQNSMPPPLSYRTDFLLYSSVKIVLTFFFCFHSCKEFIPQVQIPFTLKISDKKPANFVSNIKLRITFYRQVRRYVYDISPYRNLRAQSQWSTCFRPHMTAKEQIPTSVSWYVTV